MDPEKPAEDPEKPVEEPEKPVEPEKPAEPEKPVMDEQKAARIESLKKAWIAKAESAGVIAKDSQGIIMLADLLAHLEYIAACFASDQKDIAMLQPIKDAPMAALQMETSEGSDDDTIQQSQKIGDLAKAFSGELSKAMEPVLGKLGDLEKSLDSVKQDVDAIKNTPTAQRPKGSVSVEKGFEVGTGAGAKSIADKEKELTEVDAEIDAHALRVKGELAVDPSLAPTLQRKGEE